MSARPQQDRGQSGMTLIELMIAMVILGIVVGTVLSGSFVVEYVTGWPGIGTLMYDALVSRDQFLAAGCAAAGAVFLALGLLVADVAQVFVDPRVLEEA